METSIGPIFLIVVLMLMALFAISVFVHSKKRKTTSNVNDRYND
ncbi:hypothetical protein [Sporosarcina sp. NPDC096371]